MIVLGYTFRFCGSPFLDELRHCVGLAGWLDTDTQIPTPKLVMCYFLRADTILSCHPGFTRGSVNIEWVKVLNVAVFFLSIFLYLTLYHFIH